MSFALFDDVKDDLASGALDKRRCLFLEPHADLIRQWEVNSPDATWRARMESVSRFGAISPWRWQEFETEAEANGYTVVFFEDPKPIFEWMQRLNDPPPVSLISNLEGTVNGFLPFQARGINFMTECERATYFQWSTGTGKVTGYEGTILYKFEQGFDLCFYVNKPNHLTDARRKLKAQTALDAMILDGTQRQREKIFVQAARELNRGEKPILIFNAEKFREDFEGFLMLVEEQDVLFIFDEMNEKYSNRTTQLYRATCEIMYTSCAGGIFYPKVGHERANRMFCAAGSATPINRDPEGWFNQIRLIDPTIYGSVTDFNNLFVAERNQWFHVTRWKNLDLMGAMAAHIVHQADKERDPEIRDQFPKKLPHENVFVDLDPKQRKLYEALEAELDTSAIAAGTSMLTVNDLLAAINCLGMICQHPRAVLKSAEMRDEFDKLWEEEFNRLLSEGYDYETAESMMEEWSRKNVKGSAVAQKLRDKIGNDKKFYIDSPKLQELAERIEKHNGKVIVFTTGNEMSIPYLEEDFTKRGITFTTYRGGIARKVGQEAIDRFRTDPSIKVFLSTDAGKSSIDLPEATLTADYDIPPVWYTLVQRRNRFDRIDSEALELQTITLTCPGTVEDRIAELVELKKRFHEQIFHGEIAEASLEFSRSDYVYILTGERPLEGV